MTNSGNNLQHIDASNVYLIKTLIYPFLMLLDAVAILKSVIPFVQQKKNSISMQI